MADLWKHGDDRDRIRDASDIVRVIGEVVALKPKGREYVGLCPFHPDRRPSMNVVPGKQIFHCFVCGTGGDVFSFVQKFHKIDFREALEFLAQRAGIELRPQRPAPSGEPGAPSPRDLRDACAAARDFFRAALQNPEQGRAAREIIRKRGIAPDMQELFQLGAAPEGWDGLVRFIAQRQLNLPAFADVGLVRKRESAQGFYDGFRNRLMFPIHDERGAVIAFGARKIDEADEPKYLNSPDARIFKKGTTLYGLHQARAEILRTRTALITEGYTDTIACHQGGFANAVATLGTALTREHAAVLRRLCETVILLFDGDDAGQRAADRAAEVFFAEDLDVKICTLDRFTDAKDPDELLKREDGHDVFTKALAAGIDLLAYRFERLRSRLAGRGMSALSRDIDEELAHLAELGLNDVRPVRRQMIVKQLAVLAGIDESTILRSIPGGRSRRLGPTPTSDVPQPAPVFIVREPEMTPREYLLGCVLCDGALWERLTPADQRHLADPAHRHAAIDQLVDAIARSAERLAAPELSEVLARLDDHPDAAQAAVALEQIVARITESDPSRLSALWDQTWQRQRLDASTSDTPTAPDDIAAQIERRRAALRQLGPDRRVLPRPG